jgi:hypothetical protein
MFLWDFSPAGETGVELWYAADGDWKIVTDDPDFDIDHPVSYHFWGYAGPRAQTTLKPLSRRLACRSHLASPQR